VKGIGALIGQAAISVLIVVIWIVNALGGIISGIWLAIVGEWGAILLGFAMSLGMPRAFTLVTLPSLGLMAWIGPAIEEGNRDKVFVLGSIASLYESSVLVAWSAIVFFSLALEAEPGTLVPRLIWAYATTMSPLAYMASKEPPGDPGAAKGLILGQLGYMVCLVLFLCGAIWPLIVPALGALAFVNVVFSMYVVVKGMNEEREYRMVVGQSLGRAELSEPGYDDKENFEDNEEDWEDDLGEDLDDDLDDDWEDDKDWDDDQEDWGH